MDITDGHMKLPNGERAIIDSGKLTAYVLNPEHPEGSNKARLFRELLGITLDNVHVLIRALQKAAASREAITGRLDPYGQRYVLDLDLVGPVGRAKIRSVWMVRRGEELPRLVTCYIL